MNFRHPFFRYGAAILLVLVILFVLGKLDYLLDPVRHTLFTILIPVVFAGLFYYIFRPIVRWFSRLMPKVLAVLAFYLTIAVVIGAVVWFAGDQIMSQVQDATESLPQDIDKMQQKTKEVVEENNFGMFSYYELRNKAVQFISGLGKGVGNNVMKLASMVTSVVTVLILIPFLLFYFLKDDHRLKPLLLTFIPKKHEDKGEEILSDLDDTLSTYIIGQMIVAVAVGVLMYIGYLIIGLDYGILLAVFAMITAIVPFMGPIIGILPAILVGLLQGPFMIVKILIVFVVVQQLEGNLVSPQVMGKRLEIHPVTVILILMAAGTLFGFFGILLGIPVYAALKVMIKDFYSFYKLRQSA